VSHQAHHLRLVRYTIPLGRRALRVVGVRVTAVDETPVLIVEDVSE
jgi:hypothetical protein